MTAYIFPGQGSQAPGMAQEIYNSIEKGKTLLENANEILGFRITDIMFEGSSEDLKQTRVTQPAIFLHSAVLIATNQISPDMVAGHSLGEFSALVANNSLQFEDALKLVSQRAEAMQKACEANPSTMAAVLGLEDELVNQICESVDGVVVAANFNCPGQLVISGANEAVDVACEKLTEAGARRALKLPVGGAFHSPLMEPARHQLEAAIDSTTFKDPICPIYQNVTAAPETDKEKIKANLMAQLTAPVKWTQSVRAMISDGATEFVELGPGRVLQGLVKKVSREVVTTGLN